MGEPIRVLQVMANMGRGGAEMMVMNYYRNVDRTKVQFDFLVHRPEVHAFDMEIESLGGKIYKMPPISSSTFFKYIKALKKFFKEHPEYTIIHSHMNALSFLVLKYAQKTCKVRIGHSHTSINPLAVFHIYKKNIESKIAFKNLFLHSIRKLTGKYATHYFACGEKAGQWLFGKKRKIRIINNAINSDEFIYDKNKSEEIKKSLKIENFFVFGHVGRFANPKNHYFLIKIFNEILKIEPKSRLLLIGDGPLMLKIIAFTKELGLEEKVIFLGGKGRYLLYITGNGCFYFSISL